MPANWNVFGGNNNAGQPTGSNWNVYGGNNNAGQPTGTGWNLFGGNNLGSSLIGAGLQGLTGWLANRASKPAQTQQFPDEYQGGNNNSGGSRQPAGSFWQGAGAAGLSGLFGLGGGIMSGMGQSAQQDAQLADSAEERAQREAQFQATLAQQKAEFERRSLEFDREQGRLSQENEMSDLLKRQQTGVEATQLDPLAQQKSRQHNALMAAYMRTASNIKGPDGTNGFQGTGGLQIPEGGFGSDVTDFFTPEARASAEGQFYNTTAPFMDPTDLTQVGYGGAGAAPTESAKAARKSWYESELARKKASQAALQGALDPTLSTIPGTANRSWMSKASKTADRLLDNTGYQRRV